MLVAVLLAVVPFLRLLAVVELQTKALVAATREQVQTPTTQVVAVVVHRLRAATVLLEQLAATVEQDSPQT
jgi:general stress protein CsbA